MIKYHLHSVCSSDILYIKLIHDNSGHLIFKLISILIYPINVKLNIDKIHIEHYNNFKSVN
jgi:hypothetical protein